MKVPRFEASVMPVRPTTLCTPTMPMAETAITRATSAMWGVLKSGWMKLKPEGNSRESAMPAVMRMAVFMALKVVPTMAMATVTAMVIMRPKPIPGIRLFPRSCARSPMGALDAAAAARPVVVTLFVTLTSLSLTM